MALLGHLGCTRTTKMGTSYEIVRNMVYCGRPTCKIKHILVSFRIADQSYIEVKLIVSHCYKIKDYTCSEPTDYQKMLPNPLHLNVGPASSIVEINDTDTLHKYWFRFCTSDHLQKKKIWKRNSQT